MAPPIHMREPADAAAKAEMSGTGLLRKRDRKQVFFPLSDTWQLVRSKDHPNRLEWKKMETMGKEPPGRSRSSLVGLPSRGLALLFYLALEPRRQVVEVALGEDGVPSCFYGDQETECGPYSLRFRTQSSRF